MLLDISADGTTAEIQLFSQTRQERLHPRLNVPCGDLLPANVAG